MGLRREGAAPRRARETSLQHKQRTGSIGTAQIPSKRDGYREGPQSLSLERLQNIVARRLSAQTNDTFPGMVPVSTPVQAAKSSQDDLSGDVQHNATEMDAHDHANKLHCQPVIGMPVLLLTTMVKPPS